MRRTTMRKGMMVVLLVLALAAGLVAAQDGLSLPWATVDGGGGLSAGGAFEVQGTAGQPDAGVAEGGAFAVRGGFWPGTGLAGGYETYLPQVTRH